VCRASTSLGLKIVSDFSRVWRGGGIEHSNNTKRPADVERLVNQNQKPKSRENYE
jgi:hypothetical protein